MLRLRTGYRTVRLLRRSLLWLAVMVMSCSLVSMGGLIWINNSWAVMPDGDPATSFDNSIVLEAMAGEVDCDDLDPDGDGQIPLTGGKLLRGNGDQDDNRPEPLRIAYRPGALMAQGHSPSPIKMWTHWTLKSYLDFGHLKVFPDASICMIIAYNFNYNGQKAASLCMRGGLLLFDRLLKRDDPFWPEGALVNLKSRGLCFACFY